ncbi:MAG: transglutaminase-like domain-containing protein [Candidatus Dojkabacteria bacterium]
MKDLTGYLKKTPSRYRNTSSLFSVIKSSIKSSASLLLVPIISTVLSFSGLVSIPKVIAETTAPSFNINVDFEHTITEETIDTQAVMEVTSPSPRVISYYTAVVPIERLRVTCEKFKTGEELECTTFNRGSNTEVLINLNNGVVRPGSPLEILIKYSIDRKGEDSSFNISSTIFNTATRSVVIKYPKDMGEPLWSSDPIQNIKAIENRYVVLIEQPQNPKLSIVFGEKLLYKFDINKVFSNSLKDNNQSFEIYVPSDTPTQTIIWEEISPTPTSSLKDEDGNYIFKYLLKPGENADCKISGYILKTEDLETTEESSSFLTQKSGYWSITNNTEFRRINTFLEKKDLVIPLNFDNVEVLEDPQKELFYKYIYQYVIERLNYNDEIPLGIDSSSRIGAQTLTEAPNNASNIDYSDFYISLLRNYNVPSRLIVGYISNITGYTSDGFYHHWVEYLDTNQNRWVTADPFLEEYFGKNLYGSPFLDHITIIRRGKSAVAPKMSFFQDTDFIVKAETTKDIQPRFSVDSIFTLENYNITKPYAKGLLKLKNEGNIALNNIIISNSNIDNLTKYTDPVKNMQSDILLPNEENYIQFNIPHEEINSSNIFVVTSLTNLDRHKIDQTLETEVKQEIPLFISILSKSLSILIFCAFLFLLYFLIKLRKKKAFKRMKKSFIKLFKKRRK